MEFLAFVDKHWDDLSTYIVMVTIFLFLSGAFVLRGE